MMPAGGGHGKKQCLTAYELNFPHVRYFCALVAREIPVTGYARTDERRDIVASLEHCALSLIRAKETDGAWKWVILSLHSALQGAMVCHLSGTAQLGALTKDSADQWLQWHENDRSRDLEHSSDGAKNLGNFGSSKDFDRGQPAERVASAPELFRRLRCSSARIEYQCGAVQKITASQIKSFRRLHRLRNEFTHFHPKGWSIEIHYMKTAIANVLDILTSISNDPWPFRHMSEDERDSLNSKIEAIRLLLSEV